MKTFNIIIALFFLLTTVTFSQSKGDVIHKLDGKTIEAKVKEVSEEVVKYNRLDNLTGPLYTLKKKEIFKIVYESGYVDVFGATGTIENTGTVGTTETAAEKEARLKIEQEVRLKIEQEKEAARLKAEQEKEAKEAAEAAKKAEEEAKKQAELAKLAKEREERRLQLEEERRIVELEYQRKKAEEEKKAKEPKKHTAYGEILGLGGFLSINYQPRIFTSKNGVLSFSGRIGLGMSNKSIHIPHGFILGVGSQRHQFELGVMGVFIGRMSDGDAFSFLYGSGKESRYTVSPQLGYRMYAKNGFTFSVNILMIYSEDAYQLSYTQDPQPGITPWFGIGLGYAF